MCQSLAWHKTPDKTAIQKNPSYFLLIYIREKEKEGNYKNKTAMCQSPEWDKNITADQGEVGEGEEGEGEEEEDRQTDRQTDSQAGRQTDRQIDLDLDKYIDR